MEAPNVLKVAMETRRVGHSLDSRRLLQCVEVGRALRAHPNLWQHMSNDIEALFAFVKAKGVTGGRKRKVSASKLYKVDCKGPCCTGSRLNIVINMPLL